MGGQSRRGPFQPALSRRSRAGREIEAPVVLHLEGARRATPSANPWLGRGGAARHRHRGPCEEGVEAARRGDRGGGGAGGHTGTINPFALMNEVRQLGDQFAIVLVGGHAHRPRRAGCRDHGRRSRLYRHALHRHPRGDGGRGAQAHDPPTRAHPTSSSPPLSTAHRPTGWTPSPLAAGIDLDVLRTTLPTGDRRRRRRTRSAGRTSTRQATGSGTSTTCRPRPSSAGAWSRSTARLVPPCRRAMRKGSIRPRLGSPACARLSPIKVETA